MKILKKILSIGVNVIFSLMLIAGASLLILRACGYRILAVETGSMGKSYPVGSLIIAEKCSADSIKVGDVISFVADEKLTTVTHRVAEVDSEDRVFITKGDANNAVDKNPVPYENLIGRVRFKLSKAGYAVIWAHTKGGKVCIVLGYALCILGTVFGSYLKSIGEGRKKEHDSQ